MSILNRDCTIYWKIISMFTLIASCIVILNTITSSSAGNCNNSTRIFIIADNTTESPPNSPNLAQQAVYSTGANFQPTNVCITINGTVNWTNNDTSFHTIASGNFSSGSDFKFISPILSQAQTFSHRFTVSGNFSYYDPMHPNLSGTVQVK